MSSKGFSTSLDVYAPVQAISYSSDQVRQIVASSFSGFLTSLNKDNDLDLSDETIKAINDLTSQAIKNVRGDFKGGVIPIRIGYAQDSNGNSIPTLSVAGSSPITIISSSSYAKDESGRFTVPNPADFANDIAIASIRAPDLTRPGFTVSNPKF